MEKAAFIGLSTVDHTYLLEEFPDENSKMFSREYLLQCGGPALNAAITYHFLGGQAKLISCFGNSSQALQALTFLRESYTIRVLDVLEGIDYTFPASSVMVNHMNGTRTIVNAPRTLYPDSIDYSGIELEDHKIVLLDGHYLDPGLRERITEARQRGVIVVMDGGSWKKDSEYYLDLVDYIVCSTRFVKPGMSLNNMPDFLHEAGIKFVAYSDNEKPIRVSQKISGSSSRRRLIEVEQIDAVDTLGAGDVLHGAFCHYLAAGHEDSEAISHAAKVATESCRFFGTHQWHKSYQSPS